MLSRVAESIYWMSRYMERAHNVSRFVEVNLNLMLDLPSGYQEQWEPLVVTTGDQDAFIEKYKEYTKESVIRFLALDEDNPNSIYSCLIKARENARSVREAITREMWQRINELYLRVKTACEDNSIIEEPRDFFVDIKQSGWLFEGITDGTMSHDEGWHFQRLGKMLERSDKTSRILDVKYYLLLPRITDVGTPFDDIQWAAVLRSASGFEMYRQAYGNLNPQHVVEFLLLNGHFPRAVRYCVQVAERSLHAIAGTPLDSYSNEAERSLGQLRAELDYADVREIIARGLHEFVDHLQDKLNRVGESIADTFFAMRPLPVAMRPNKSYSYE